MLCVSNDPFPPPAKSIHIPNYIPAREPVNYSNLNFYKYVTPLGCLESKDWIFGVKTGCSLNVILRVLYETFVDFAVKSFNC
jgi:hypothetical protein